MLGVTEYEEVKRKKVVRVELPVARKEMYYAVQRMDALAMEVHGRPTTSTLYDDDWKVTTDGDYLYFEVEVGVEAGRDG